MGNNRFNKFGLKSNNIITDELVTSKGVKFLNEVESDAKYLKESQSRGSTNTYNWQPDYSNTIRGIKASSYTIPVNGWLSIDGSVNSSDTFYINNNLIGTIKDVSSFQTIVKANDVIKSGSGQLNFSFSPTKSELLDWRENPTPYDIWAGAIIRDENGVSTSTNLFIPNASGWKSNIYDANNLTITKVEDNKAYNGTTFVCNIQTDKIVKGKNMFYNSYNLTTFTSDLSSLTDGTSMFYDTYLTTFTSDLSSLTDGTSMFYYCLFTSFDSDLSSLRNGESMFEGCRNLTTFTSNLSSLTNGKKMFNNCNNLTTFESDLSSLRNGESMFEGCRNLTTFTSDLSSLTDGSDMFNWCTRLTTFTSDLSSLTVGDSMFYYCGKLTTFTSDLSSLTDGGNMFDDCSSLTTFSSNLSSLTDGYSMFYDCSGLTSFGSDLSSLTNGNYMFQNCSALTTFTSDLSSLTNGNYMFNGCNLNSASVEKILTSIPTYTSGSRTLAMTIQSAAATKFGEITGTTPTSTSVVSVTYKGWTINVNLK